MKSSGSGVSHAMSSILHSINFMKCRVLVIVSEYALLFCFANMDYGCGPRKSPRISTISGATSCFQFIEIDWFIYLLFKNKVHLLMLLKIWLQLQPSLGLGTSIPSQTKFSALPELKCGKSSIKCLSLVSFLLLKMCSQNSGTHKTLLTTSFPFMIYWFLPSIFR